MGMAPSIFNHQNNNLFPCNLSQQVIALGPLPFQAWHQSLAETKADTPAARPPVLALDRA
jgi:hypothetical protein